MIFKNIFVGVIHGKSNNRPKGQGYYGNSSKAFELKSINMG
jgi:hypothetical protein